MKMTCQDLETSLVDYLYDELEPTERGEVEHHLADCAGCRDALSALGGTRQLMAALPEAESVRSTDFILQAAEREARLRAERKAEPSGMLARLGRWISGHPGMVAGAMAGMVLLAVVGINVSDEVRRTFGASADALAGAEAGAPAAGESFDTGPGLADLSAQDQAEGRAERQASARARRSPEPALEDARGRFEREDTQGRLADRAVEEAVDVEREPEVEVEELASVQRPPPSPSPRAEPQARSAPPSAAGRGAARPAPPARSAPRRQARQAPPRPRAPPPSEPSRHEASPEPAPPPVVGGSYDAGTPDQPSGDADDTAPREMQASRSHDAPADEDDVEAASDALFAGSGAAAVDQEAPTRDAAPGYADGDGAETEALVMDEATETIAESRVRRRLARRERRASARQQRQAPAPAETAEAPAAGREDTLVQGRRLVAEGRCEEAVSVLAGFSSDQAERMAEAHLLRARCLERLGRQEEAYAAYRAAVAAAPGGASARRANRALRREQEPRHEPASID